MTDARFYKRQGPFTLGDLATIGECEILRGDPALVLRDVAPLDEAEAGEIGVFNNLKYGESLKVTRASACILSPDVADKAPSSLALLTTKHPYKAYALIATAFYPPEKKAPGIDPTAVVDSSARIGKDVFIGPMAIIESDVELADGVEIASHAVIGKGVTIGENSKVGSHVTLSHALVGKSVHIKPGARIGQSGFGFFMDQGDMGGHVPVPQLGRVIIQDFVEIGANTTVDRGSGADTIIGTGTRIDNLVQVAHNVHFGKGCVMAAQSGVSGSTKFGDYVAAGGQVGIIEHLKIGTGARLAAQSGILRDIEPGEILCGSPAMPLKSYYRQVAVLRRLADKTRNNSK